MFITAFCYLFILLLVFFFFFFSSRRRHTRCLSDWSSDVCSSDLPFVRNETRVEEDNYVAALEWADSIGVDIVSSSLAYLVFDNGFSYTPSQLNGDIAVTTVAADMAAQRGILVVTAAGNSGPGSRSIWTPADGDSVL